MFNYYLRNNFKITSLHITKAMDDGSFEGLVDPRLKEIYDKQLMPYMVTCVAFSIRHSTKRCPKMSQVINNISIHSFHFSPILNH